MTTLVESVVRAGVGLFILADLGSGNLLEADFWAFGPPILGVTYFLVILGKNEQD